MYNFKPLRGIFVWFCIFDPNHILSFYNGKSRVGHILHIIAKTIFLTLILLSAIKPFNDTSIATRDYIVAGVSFLILIVNLVEIAESCVHSSKIQSIAKEVAESINYLNISTDMSSRVQCFALNFYKKIIFCTVIFLIELISRISTPTKFISSHSNILISFAALYKHTAILHVTFYIDLNVFILQSLNDQLNPVKCDSINNCLTIPTPQNIAMRMMCHIKYIIMHVWRISEKINQRFGCFLLFAFINSFANIIRVGTAFFMALVTESSPIYLLRKLN